MNVQPSLITNSQTAEAVEPGERALTPLRSYSSVPSQLLTALYSSPGNPRYDASLAEGFSVSLGVVPFVSVQLDGALTWPTAPLCTSPDARNNINHFLQHSGVGYVSTCKLQGNGYSSSADHRSNATLALGAGRRRTKLPLSVGFGPVPCSPFYPHGSHHL